jgi:hypothetical protein
MAALRHQSKLKNKEFQSQASLRARELIFDIRRKKYDASNEEAGAVMRTLGDLIAKYSFVAESKRREIILPTLKFIQRSLIEIALSPAPVYAEGLQYIHQMCSEERLNFLRETLNMDLEKLPNAEYSAVMWRYAEIFNELEGIRVGTLETICHETFDDFLPESLRSTEPPKLPVVKTRMDEPQKLEDSKPILDSSGEVS